MSSRYRFLLIALIAWLGFAPSALAQQGEPTEEGEADAGADETEEEDDEEEDEEDDELDDENFEDEEEDEEDLEGDLELAPPQTIDLDMDALGDMDPEADLTGDGALTEDEAAAEAVEDWTEREMEILELHGYLRVRPELYHKFYMRHTDDAVFQRPAVMLSNQTADPEGYLGEDCREDGGERARCHNSTLAGANMRLRVEPTLNISEEVWIKTQIDFLDNAMLGSSPRYYQNYGSGDTIDTASIQGWNMGPPSSDMIVVRRAWGEVMTPLGQLRFGRMGDHFGLGMLHNAGNGIDQDFGDTVDRLMFAAKVNDWIIAPAFDFPNEGVSAVSAAGRPFDVGQLDDAYQLVGIVAYKHDEEEQLAMLRRGDWVINTGVYFAYRWQVLSFENPAGADQRTVDSASSGHHFYRRDMWMVTPDLWFQFLYDTFHLELEAALIYGQVGNPDRDLSNFDEASPLTLTQWGGVLQIDYGLLSDQLRIGLEFGFASGDEHVDGLHAPTTFDQQNNPRDNTYTAFAFNPAYNTDLILYHHILGTVTQSYYFRPWLRYDFLRSALGKQLGVQVDVLYSRAVYDETTISNSSANLGIEIDAQLMYVSADNFHAGIKYGVLFPLGAFEGSWDPDNDPSTENSTIDNDLTIPQTLQILMGISF
ncbi:MAG: TIGR04551 family protein [Deltaproteobacteria bacterium]|nr:TIGR04551 family protein [Deltaproteobacteria bacterium]